MEVKKKSVGSIIYSVLGVILGFAIIYGIRYFNGSKSMSTNISEMELSAKDFEKAAKEADEMCPQQVDENTVMKRCLFQNGRFVYQYDITGYTIDDLDFNSLRQLLVATIPTINTDFSTLALKLAEAGYGLEYQYYDNGGSSRSIVFTADDINAIFAASYTDDSTDLSTTSALDSIE